VDETEGVDRESQPAGTVAAAKADKEVYEGSGGSKDRGQRTAANKTEDCGQRRQRTEERGQQIQRAEPGRRDR